MRLEPRLPEPHLPRVAFLREREHAEKREPPAHEASPARLNDSEREALLLNIDVSLRVHARAQLFS
jgi:hypothetical protein